MSRKLVYAIPSANYEAASASLPLWRARGYKIAVLVPSSLGRGYQVLADLVLDPEMYYGYPWAVATLIEHKYFDDVDIVICGGDDIYPDDSKDCQQLANEFYRQFPDGFGVMQPTGDGHGCDAICGSPWMGISFARGINHGLGPFWPEYHHFYCDQELKIITERMHILWKRVDVTQRHEHWSWTSGQRPVHMFRNREFHEADKLLFMRRQSQNFPDHEFVAREHC